MAIIHSCYKPFQIYFRTARMRLVQELFALTPGMRVLDVGGSIFNWNLLPFRPRLTLVNLTPPPDGLPADVECIQGDATQLDLPSGYFDLVYSNSVIEHLSTWSKQEAMAAEMRRLGRRYFVQTPDRWFFMEPHLITPFIHYLPESSRRRLVRRCSAWAWITHATQAQCDAFVNEVRLLTRAEMQTLFPDANILHERFLGMSKSIMAVKTA